MKNSTHSWAKLVGMIALVVVASLLPSIALAGPFELANDDLSRKTFIEPLFGPITGGPASPLTTLMYAFNGALLVVGGILLAYTIVAGAMSTAHDGEMLGKRWSAMWIPIRTSLGVGAVLPVIGGGWCVAQVIVVWLAMQGAGLANTLWNAFVGEDGGSILTAASYNPPTNLPAVRDAYAAMLVNNACVSAHQKDILASGPAANLMGLEQYGVTDASTAGKLILYYGRTDANFFTAGRENTCGMLMLEEEDPGDSALRGDNSTSSEILNMASINKPVIEARHKAFVDAQAKLAILGEKIAQDEATQEDVNTVMSELLQTYSNDVSAAAKAAYKSSVNTKFLDTMKQDGWVMAGAFYMQLSKTQDIVTRAITNAPAVSSAPRPRADLGDNLLSGEVLGANSPAIMKIVETAAQMASQSNRDLVGGVSSIGSDASGGSDSVWVTRLLGWFVGKDSAFTSGTEALDFNENPIIMAKGLGEKMTMGAWSALGVATLGQVALGGGATGIGAFLAPVFAGIFFAMIIPGAVLSTYLPMLPYILWLGVVLGWAILLVEAVIAAPLWAIVHLAPDGDGVVGRGGQGYMLVLSLVLRPPLMVIGLIAAFVLMKPLGFLVNSTFIGAFQLGVSPGAFGVTQAIAGCIIYCGVMITIVHRVFSLIHVIPDRLLRWIGGGGGGELGQEAGEMDRGANAKLAAGFSAASNMSQGLQQGLQGANMKRLENKQNAARAQIENSQRLSGQKQDATDKLQDARIASSSAEGARGADGAGGNEAMEAQAQKAQESAARALENSAMASAQMSPDKDSKNYAKNMDEARKKGPLETDALLKRETARAAQMRSENKPLAPYQEDLLNRQEAIDKALDHGKRSGSISAVRRKSQSEEMAAQQAEAESVRFKQQASALSQAANREAKAHPTSRSNAFREGLIATNGNEAARAEHWQKAVDEAKRTPEDQREPFQHLVLERAEARENMRSYQQHADTLRGKQPTNPGVTNFEGSTGSGGNTPPPEDGHDEQEPIVR